jgi:hypothetical protein
MLPVLLVSELRASKRGPKFVLRGHGVVSAAYHVNRGGSESTDAETRKTKDEDMIIKPRSISSLESAVVFHPSQFTALSISCLSHFDC